MKKTFGIRSLLGANPSEEKKTNKNSYPVAALLGQTGVGKT